MRRDLLGPTISLQQSHMGSAYFLQWRSDLALEWLLKARSSNPKLPRTHASLAAAYAQKGDDAAARLAVETLLRIALNFKISDLIELP